MRIADLDATDPALRDRAAQLLVDGFAEHWPESWPDLASGLRELDECARLGVLRGAFEDDGLVGWSGVRHSYARVWEIHPVVVDVSSRRRGIGRALLEAVEAVAARRGGLVVTLGSDDTTGMTSIAGVDLYPDPLEHLARIEDVNGHPFVFYRRCGYAVSGVTPDANGLGRPDIHMTKRIARS